MKLIDLDADKDYLLDGKYKVRAGSDYLPVSKQIKKILQKIARKKQDNDYIKKEDAIIQIERFGGYLDDDMLYRIKLALGRLPSADVVKVIRCKNCKWWTKQEDSLQGRCALMQSYPTGAWYCANGKRKDDE